MGWRAILIVLGMLPASLRCELLPIRTFTTADGLAADHVDCIVPDSRGFLWFCTQEGLSRFDGNHFVTYGAADGLAHSAVSALIETRSGEYLVGTARGISRFRQAPHTAGFLTYAPDPPGGRNYVTALYESPGGTIWCATTGGLFQWSPEAFHRRPLSLPPGVVIGDIVEDRGHDLWIAAREGLFLVRPDGSVQTFDRNRGLPGTWCEMLLLDSRGRLWAALRGGIAVLARNPSGDWAVEETLGENSGLPSLDVKALLEASDGTLWVGTAQGISRIRWNNGRPQVFQNLTRAQGLSDRQVGVLAEDRAGNIWAGTEGAGVMRIDRLGFTTYREQDGLPIDRVFSVFSDQAGDLLAVTAGAGTRQLRSLEIFDGVRFHSATPKPYGRRASWGWNQIVLQSRAGEWWAATKDGLCRYPAVRAAQLNGRDPQACYAPGQIVFRVFEDSRGGIWASAQSSEGDQLMRWDHATSRLTTFPPRVPGSRSDDLVSSFAEDSHGNVWMGLYKGGLYRYDGRAFTSFKLSDGVPAGPAVVLLSSRGGLWIASSGGGLARVQDTAADRPHFEIYNAGRGMASNVVTCLVEDPRGRIYAGTGKGVDRLDPSSGHILHFSSGLPHAECTAAVRDRTGALWFATRQGLSRLIPPDERPPVAPRILITQLRIAGAPHPVSERGETRISELELQPSQNHLQVEFVGIDYEPGDVLHYSYKLEAADSAWSVPRAQQSVDFAALAAGKYRFLVKAVTAGGAESSAPAEIDFTVLPPVWKRWWFETAALLLAAALVFAAHRYRLLHLVNLERMRTAIATDLHDDIGASLSHIAVLSEVARAAVGGENRRAQESLDRVAVLARELVDSLSDIVWSIRAVPDGFDSLVSRMREFALELLGSQRIDFELRSFKGEPGAQDLGLHLRRHLLLAFKECIHNVSRHSGCTAVRAELKAVDREILLTVADNGRGLKETAPSGGGNGIPGMRRRAAMLGGSMQLLSRPGEGCTVSMRIPLRRRRYSFK